MSAKITNGTLVSTFFRSFFIQASWNYHNMIGNGFAWALLPALRRLYGSDAVSMDAALRRHLDHFNAHPYLSNLALGATLRLEEDGTDPETVRRFKTAVRGPLGGLGDSLVWATWLPLVSMVALAAWWAGSPGWVSVVLFLVLYNIGHLGLRVWGFRNGLREGRGLAQVLSRANLTALVKRLQGLSALVVGVLVGALLTGPRGVPFAGSQWIAAGAVAFLAGLVVGHRAWRPAATVIVSLVIALTAWGGLR